MSLYNGIDPTAYVSSGVYSETYNSTGANLNSLFVSLGMLEDAPNIAIKIVVLIMQQMNQFMGGDK